MTWDAVNEWVNDSDGNRCSVAYFGTKEAAETALKSLKNCRNCVNCSGCSRCSDCSRCSRCSRCSDCSRCSRCSDCSDCSGCSRCSRCSLCSDCSDCSGCSRCSRCSLCSDCSGCSDCAYLYAKKNMKPIESEAVSVAMVPVIPDIHQKVYDAVTQPHALYMGSWHTCETTHCRAGWVVHLAGEAGYALESFHNTELAAMLIYRESGYPINPARFHDSNDAALADMKRLAETD